MAEDDVRVVAPAEAPAAGGMVEFREGWVGRAVTFVVLAVIAAGALAAPYVAFPAAERSLPVVIAGWWVGGWAGLFALLFWQSLRGAIGAGGWVLRASPEHLLVNLRSFRNYNFSTEAATVLVIPRRRVRHLRGWRQRGLRPMASETGVLDEARMNRQALLIALDGEPPPALAEALEHEGRRMGPSVIPGARSRSNHAPVRLRPGGVVEIAWRDESSRVALDVDAALTALRRWYRVAEARETEEAPVRLLGEAEREARLVALVERGDVIGAVKVAKALYGMTTTQARRFVQELAEGPDTGRRPPAPRN